MILQFTTDKPLTREIFDAIIDGEPFATGLINDEPGGCNMTSSGTRLRWVAKKGAADDWAVYCHWQHHSAEWILDSGDKVSDDTNIRACVPCTDEVLRLYRK